MKTNLIVSALLLAIIIAGCSKNNSTTTPQSDSYLNTSANSSWNYEQTDSSTGTGVVNNYVITSTSKDTVINSKTYHIYTNSDGGFNYQNVSGHDYYQYDSLPAGFGTGVFERLYLKDNGTAGSGWSQDFNVNIPGFPIAVPVTLTNNIVERDISRVVNGVTYTSVIHTSTSISSSLIPTGLTTAINSYYAAKYGLIENSTIIQLDYLGLIENVNLHTRLMSADLK